MELVDIVDMGVNIADIVDFADIADIANLVDIVYYKMDLLDSGFARMSLTVVFDSIGSVLAAALSDFELDPNFGQLAAAEAFLKEDMASPMSMAIARQQKPTRKFHTISF